MAIIFQDVQFKNQRGNIQQGFFMDNTLKHNIDEFLIKGVKQKFDGIVLMTGLEGCQPKGSKVMLSDGNFKNIEDIKVGDSVLSPQEDGSHTYAKVLSTTNWFCDEVCDVITLNRGKRKLYSCSNNHLIPTNIIRTKGHTNRERFWKTENIRADNYSKKGKYSKLNCSTFSSFMIDRFEGRDNCKIGPYFLGVFLGDGVLNKCLRIHNSKKEIYKKLNSIYPVMSLHERTNANIINYSKTSKPYSLLSKLGLYNKDSGGKFIPEGALYSDKDYRLKLLAGLIDTDGYLDKNGNYQYTTKSERLAKDILFLIHSLGMRGTCKKVVKGIKSSGFKGIYYQINFYSGDTNIPLVVKKKIRTTSSFLLSSNRMAYDVVRSKSQQVYGFELDSKSKWYITDNYMVTHNTGKSTFAKQLAAYCGSAFGRNLTLNNIVFTGKDLMDRIDAAKIGTPIIFDEAIMDMASQDAATEMQRILIKKFTLIRKKRLFIFIVIPSIFMLRKYFAIYRTRVMINSYCPDGITRGFFKAYSFKNKKTLYLRGWKEMNMAACAPNFSGRFPDTTGFFIDEDEYERKKDEAIKALTEDKEPSAVQKIKDDYDLYKVKLHEQLERFKEQTRERYEKLRVKSMNTTKLIKLNEAEKHKIKISEAEQNFYRTITYLFRLMDERYYQENHKNLLEKDFCNILAAQGVLTASPLKIKQALQYGKELIKK